LAGFWPDKGEQHRSTMRNSEYLSIRSEGMCPGHQPPRTYLRIRRLRVRVPPRHLRARPAQWPFPNPEKALSMPLGAISGTTDAISHRTTPCFISSAADRLSPRSGAGTPSARLACRALIPLPSGERVSPGERFGRLSFEDLMETASPGDGPGGLTPKRLSSPEDCLSARRGTSRGRRRRDRLGPRFSTRGVAADEDKGRVMCWE
jgi:hypothetical protein